MEEFKIINFKQQSIEEEEIDEIEETEEDDYVPPRKRFLLIPLLLILIVAAYIVWLVISSYTDFDIENKWERKDASESHYIEFDKNLIKISSDGVFYTTYNGSLIWNYTYNMINPQAEICDNYLIAYDKKGNEIDVFSSSGYINTINTTIPIIEAKIAKSGTVAVMLQEAGVTYIQLISAKGVVLASGEIHPENGGYPISIALSKDAKRLAISMLNISSGNVRTDLRFYDFSSTGKEQEDNIVATYTYVDMLIPQVEFLSGDRAVAFGEKEIIIFNDNSAVTVEKEIYIENQINNIFYNDKYFGYVEEAVSEMGEIENVMSVYNMYGFKCLKHVIEDNYDQISILKNNQILLINGNSVSLFNMQGFNRFKYDFDENVYMIIPGTTTQRYYVVKESCTEEIHLK